jgi:polygalacturonase
MRRLAHFFAVPFLICSIGLNIRAATAEAPAWETILHRDLEAMAAHLTANLKPWPVPERIFKVEDYGAIANGTTLNTAAIQKTIDACSAAGGGVVLFTKGDYVTGTIDLKSGVMIELAKEARLLGSTKLSDYPERIPQRTTIMDTYAKIKRSLIYAEGVERIGFRGPGTIDFRGLKKNFPGKQTTSEDPEDPGRPFGIRIIDSRQIVVENITFKDAARWMQNYLNCEDLILQKLTVINHANYNNDGIDIDGCRRVIVRDCLINSSDDAISLKGASLCPTEDVLIENSTFVTSGNALKIGTDTQGDFRRIYARNCKLGGIPETMLSASGHEASTGITLATVDGGDVEDILISGVVIERSRAPIFLCTGSRGRLLPGMPPAKVGKLRRIVIENVTGKENFRQGSLISGIKDGLVEDVVIRNVNFSMNGGGTAEMAAASVAEKEKGYPDAYEFSVNGLPAYGFYLRHARNVLFENVRVALNAADARPAFVNGGDAENITINGQPLLAPLTTQAKP